MADQIMTSKKGSFARFTITDRVPAILDDLIAHNRFSPETEKRLMELRASLPSGELAPLSSAYPFSRDINQVLAENSSYGWLNGPFLFLENYLYHRISDICGFYSNGFDYFLYRKESESRKGLNKFADSLKRLEKIGTFSEICLMNLAGNKADLSQNSSYYSSDADFDLLIDHRSRAAAKLENCSSVDILLDNGGEELFFDLLLTHWLLKHKKAGRVKLHFKRMPYFVSDALISDYRFLLRILSEKKETARFAEDLNRYESGGMLALGDDPFLVSGKPFSRLEGELAAELSRSDLIIFKGDLNYRRLVGDNDWPHETRTSSLVNYFNTDILISRILKSEVMTGLDPGMIPLGNNTDWMFNGKYGQIEFVESI